MPDKYRVVRGEYFILGKQPDGDSIRFRAENVALWNHLPGGGHVKVTPSDQTVQLRFQGIDAPELHYQGEQQPFGRQARDVLLNEMNFGLVTYSGLTVTNVARKVHGAVLVRQAEQHGRPISYLLWEADANGLADGAMVDLDAARLKLTLSHLMLERGMAYPLFYTSMPAEHRSVFAATAKAARDGEVGLWPQDVTRLFELVTEDSIGPDGQLIFPKLFRRCTDYLHDLDHENFVGSLTEWMQFKQQNDPVHVAGAPPVPFSSLIEQEAANVRFKADLLDLVFVGD
jgi:hypothetical protein